MKKPVVSIIIVHYKVKKELFNCLASIYASKTKCSVEIIVVDNDEKKSIKKELLHTFSQVRYIAALKNKGFGAGNNLGSRSARGKYLFFLNPDTVILKCTIDNLAQFLDRHRESGIVAPLLVTEQNKLFKRQGSDVLTPIAAIFSLSFLHKFFPKNPIARKYFLSSWDKKTIKKVAVVAGSAFMMRHDIFEDIGGFDECFFLYFEEDDLCFRVRKLGYTIVILPKTHVIHYIGKSTEKYRESSKMFAESRYLYFKKYYGNVTASVIHVFLQLRMHHVLLAGIMLTAIWLRFFKLDSLMPFIGDFGWFYLSASDMLLTGSIPLVGITSSHTWLHQGPWWTYMLAAALWVSHFHPVSGAYLSAGIGVGTVYVMYYVGKKIFGTSLALIAALLFATSPLVIIHSRMPYHTNPIPLFTLLYFFSVHQWTTNKKYYFPLSLCFLAILYNFELATIVLAGVLLLLLGFGIWKKKQWALRLWQKDIFFLSGIAIVLPMMPILLYDMNNGFPQTIKFVAWIFYKIVTIFAISSGEHISSLFQFLVIFANRLVFLPSVIATNVLLISSFVWILYQALCINKKGHMISPQQILSIFFFVSLFGLIADKTSSEAYLPMFFPIVVFIIAYFFHSLLRLSTITIAFLGIIIIGNVTLLLQQNYLMGFGGYGPTFSERLEASASIISKAGKTEYNLEGRGPGSQFESFIMNYQYLTWWIGHGPSKTKQNVIFVISEEKDGIRIKQK